MNTNNSHGDMCCMKNTRASKNFIKIPNEEGELICDIILKIIDFENVKEEAFTDNIIKFYLYWNFIITKKIKEEMNIKLIFKDFKNWINETNIHFKNQNMKKILGKARKFILESKNYSTYNCMNIIELFEEKDDSAIFEKID